MNLTEINKYLIITSNPPNQDNKLLNIRIFIVIKKIVYIKLLSEMST